MNTNNINHNIPLISLKKAGAIKDGRVILDSIDLDVFCGDFITITGPSGSGKTTLLFILGGLENPCTGSCVWPLLKCDSSSFRRFYGGFIFQFHHLLGELTALENIMLPLLLRGITEKKARNMAKEALENWGLSDLDNRHVFSLSGGERQAVAVLRASTPNPAVILADEPTGSLDPESSARIFCMLKELSSQGIAVISVTHNQELAAQGKRRFQLKAGSL